MFKIGYDKKITMVQGDTGVIRMRISNYELSQGDEVRFAIANKANPSILLCQHSDKKIVLEKQVIVFEKDGSARIVIYPYDTEYLQPGKYLYEIQVKTKDGRIDTVVPLTSFTLMDGSIQGEYGQTTPSRPEPTPSEIELRFKRLENEIIPELGNRITNVENEIDSITFYKSPQMFGAKGDGQSHKIKETLPTISLAEVQELNPNATLDDETDWFAIQKAIKTHKSVYIPNGTYKISKPIVIDRPNVMLEFSPFACLQACNNTPSVLQVGTSDTPYQTNNVFNVKILNPWLSGENKTNVGLEIKCCGEHSVIRNPRISSFDKGIRTSCFDCFQLNEIYEPLLVRNNIGLDDSNGGLQAVRIFGGRIENNDNYGIVSASPNTKYIGSVIEGNKKAEIKLVNTTNANGGVAPSKLNLTSGYIEHSIYEGNEGIILLDGRFLGGVNIINSDIFSHGDEMIKHTGSSMLSCKIYIHGGMLSVPQLFNLPYMTSDSVINVNADFIESGTFRPVLTGVTGNAKINYSSLGDLYNSNYLHTNGVFGKDGVNKPTAVVHTKKLYLEPLSSTGGEQRCITYSKQVPWLDNGTGILAGSIHIDLSQLLGYMRITTKSGEDKQSNWKIIFNPFTS